MAHFGGRVSSGGGSSGLRAVGSGDGRMLAPSSRDVQRQGHSRRVALAKLRGRRSCKLGGPFTKAASPRHYRHVKPSATEDLGSSSTSDFADASIPQDVLEMFKEAQQRIIDLNQGRLHALEELAEARAKIIDLEERLTQAEKDALGMTMEVAREASELKDDVNLLPQSVEEVGQVDSTSSDLYSDLNDMDIEIGLGLDSKTPFETTAGVISLLYETSWEPAYIHFNSPEQSSWTDSPGMKMKAGELPNHKIFSISASNLEFVLNDGDAQWDKPSYEANYFIGSPGSYILKKGKLEKVR